eukprot:TRINITY_DN2479_c0_g1_i1.p1 TRINITY_DN2479_c0_g1~~TRINITY_DN2479_c0_g1_i1.p1  ORF type:complete len:473 (+),score=152.88 TRINITY_DN2479_c0_g1_i1:66-1484(+)
MSAFEGVPADSFERFCGDDLEVFGVDAEFKAKLQWVDKFVREEIEPLDQLGFHPMDIEHPLRKALFPPLQQRVKEQGLWACHLGPELGGPGYGQLKLALMNMLLGRSACASKVFGTSAPDTGNSEILAHFGTPEQKRRYLEPLLADKVSSCWSMTEPTAGADPKQFKLRAEQDPATGDWILNGEKIWSSNARYASFFLVVAVTDPDASAYKRQSIFIVDAKNPGLKIIRNLGVGFREISNGGSHGHVGYVNCRVPATALLGRRGDGFLVQQTRLSGGRIHYGMRAVGLCKRALEMMMVRAHSRFTQGEALREKQHVQKMIADAWMETEQLKLMVLRTAWKIDKYNDYKKVRHDISACKILCSQVQASVARKAIQLHGGIGISWDLPLTDTLIGGIVHGIADGPSEVHVGVVAKQIMRGYHGTPGPFPLYLAQECRKRAFEKFAPALAKAGITLKKTDDADGVRLSFTTAARL